MLQYAIILVFLSAILHVSWNVMLQSEKNPLNTSTKAMSLGIAILTPFVIWYWYASGSPVIPFYAILFGFLSGVAELCYFFFLSYSYRHGELSVVYPIARGSAPVLTFFFGIFLLQERVNSLQIAGVILLIIGIWLVRSVKISGKKGLIPATLTGVFIAAYTIIDKIGLSYTTPVFFGELKFLFTTACLLLFIPISRHFNKSYKQSNTKTSFKKIALIGIFLIIAYQLILFALSMSPVAIVSPLRESASVVVTAWGIWKLKEREGLYLKVAGVISIFIGIILLAL
jgi:drug/metabolite transporter (DMT)-like permease